jgi:putative lipoprotein
MIAERFLGLVLGLGALAATLPVLAQQAATAPVSIPGEQQTPGGPGIAKGLLLVHEGRVFMAPCRDRSYLNVDDASVGRAVLGALKDFGLAPGRNLYAELLAVQRGGSLEVSGINFVHITARCMRESKDTGEWRAVGLQADWEAMAGGGTLRIERIGEAEAYAIDGEIERDGETVRIAGAGTTLTVAPGICRLADGSTMAGWKASLLLANGEVLQGCAWER